jgi:hypothetical protein
MSLHREGQAGIEAQHQVHAKPFGKHRTMDGKKPGGKKHVRSHVFFENKNL